MREEGRGVACVFWERRCFTCGAPLVAGSGSMPLQLEWGDNSLLPPAATCCCGDMPRGGCCCCGEMPRGGNNGCAAASLTAIETAARSDCDLS